MLKTKRRESLIKVTQPLKGRGIEITAATKMKTSTEQEGNTDHSNIELVKVASTIQTVRAVVVEQTTFKAMLCRIAHHSLRETLALTIKASLLAHRGGLKYRFKMIRNHQATTMNTMMTSKRIKTTRP